jgi:hypothetical protein
MDKFECTLGARGRSAAEDPENDAPGPHFVRPRPPCNEFEQPPRLCYRVVGEVVTTPAAFWGEARCLFADVSFV